MAECDLVLSNNLCGSHDTGDWSVTEENAWLVMLVVASDHYPDMNNRRACAFLILSLFYVYSSGNSVSIKRGGRQAYVWYIVS